MKTISGLGVFVFFYSAISLAGLQRFPAPVECGGRAPTNPWQQCLNAADELNAQQMKELDAGNQVALRVTVQGDWPLAKIYQLVRATPEQVTAVFRDYGNQPNYLKDAGILDARVSKVISPVENWVDYVVDVGFLWMKSTYTTHNVLSADPSAERYRLSWEMVRADSATVIDGLARTQRRGSDALFVYWNYTVISAGPFEGMAREKGFERFQTTVKLLDEQVDREVKEVAPPGKTTLLEREVADLRKALGQ